MFIADVTLATTATAVTYNGFKSIEDKEAYDRKLQTPLRKEAILGQFLEKKKHGKHQGKFGSFRKIGRITPRMGELQEGVLPDPNSAKIYEYRYTLARYGDWIKYTDEAEEYPIDDIHAALVEEMSYSYKDFVETKRLQIFKTSKNRWFASKADGTAVTAKTALTSNGLFLDDLPKMAAFFVRNHVQPVKDNKYVIVIPPEALIQLESLKKDSNYFTFVEINKDMQTADVIYNGAEGKLFRFLFIVSDTIKVEANTGAGSGAASYFADCLVLGKVNGKFGATEISLEGENAPELINKGTDTGGVENALNQVGSIGWKNHGYGGIVEHEEAVIIYSIGLGAEGYAEWADTNRNSVTNAVTNVGAVGAQVGSTTTVTMNPTTGKTNGK